MSVILRPNSTISSKKVVVGDGYQEIDESVADDGDYVTMNGAGGQLIVGLDDPPANPDLATVSFRAKTLSSGTLTCSLYQGTTLIGASSATTLSSSFTTYTFSPTVTSVTDWTNVRLQFDGNGSALISWAQVETFRTYSDTLTFESTPGLQLGSTSSANIHAFTRSIYGEVWFIIPIGGTTSHNYYAFCVDESLRASGPVWFKGSISAAAVLDDPLLGADTFWSCLRIADETGADLYSFDKRTGGDIATDWSLTSSAFYIDEGQRRVMISRFHKDFQAQDGTVTLNIATYDEPGGDQISSGSYPITGGKTDFRISGRLMTMTFSGSDQWRLGKPGFEITVTGER